METKIKGTTKKTAVKKVVKSKSKTKTKPTKKAKIKKTTPKSTGINQQKQLKKANKETQSPLKTPGVSVGAAVGVGMAIASMFKDVINKYCGEDKKKVYVAGKISGLPKHEYVHNFTRAEEKLVKDGYEVLNPLILVTEPTKPMSEMSTSEQEEYWKKCMLECIGKGVFECDIVYVQKNWEQSRGARIEVSTAKELGKMLIFEV